MDGKIEEDVAKARHKPLKHKCTGKFNTTWCTRFKRRFMWRQRRQTAPGNYLPHGHWKMQRFRQKFRSMLEYENVDHDMVLCYDQVYRCKFRGTPTQLFKEAELAGIGYTQISNVMGMMCRNCFAQLHVSYEGKMETSLNKRTRTSMTQCQQNMGMEVAERLRTNRRAIRKSSHAEVSRIPINDERMGYTMVTSWWSNGDSGPLMYVVPEQKFPATLIKVFHICLAVLSACLHPLDLSVTFWLSHLLTYLWSSWQYRYGLPTHQFMLPHDVDVMSRMLISVTRPTYPVLSSMTSPLCHYVFMYFPPSFLPFADVAVTRTPTSTHMAGSLAPRQG